MLDFAKKMCYNSIVGEVCIYAVLLRLVKGTEEDRKFVLQR
jgi:hypothetical protein